MKKCIKLINIGLIFTPLVAMGTPSAERERIEFYIEQLPVSSALISTAIDVPDGYHAVMTSISFGDIDSVGNALEGETEKQAKVLLSSLESKLIEKGIPLRDVIQVNAFLVSDTNSITVVKDPELEIFNTFLNFIPRRNLLPDYQGWILAHSQFWGTLENPQYPISTVVVVDSLPTAGALLRMEVISLSKNIR